MAKAKRTPVRREEALSLERIVDAAIAILDADGADGLTFRALARRLETGPGALYWHVANKTELLVAATDSIVASSMREAPASLAPKKAIRAIALGLFEAIDAHPWLGAQLSRAPWPSSTLSLFEHVGRHVQALGARGGGQFTAASTLVSYILGVSVQNAAQGRSVDASRSREDYLANEAARWKELDPRDYPFTRSVANHLKRHDDRAEFLAGIDLLLVGISGSS